MQAQVVMEFFTIQGEGRRPVERLDRFGGEKLTKEGELDKRSGKLLATDYQHWLRFYSPLSERGSI